MRVPAWFGFLFVILSGVIVVLSPFWPPLGASTAEVVTYYRDHRIPFLLGNLIAIGAAVPSFVQIAALCMLIKKAEGEGGWLWLAVLGSSVLAHAAGSIALIAYQVVPFELDAGQEAVAKGFNDFAGVSFACFLLILTGFVGFTGWAVLKTECLPRWFGLSTIPLSVACLHASAGALTTEPRWLAGGGLASAGVTSVFFLWCAALSVLFLRLPPGD
ncbi:MAG: hypothetical protein QM817_39995 [Archangium sp.]